MRDWRYIKFLFLLLLSACSPFAEMQYDVLRPADFTVPLDIKSVVIVDNSFPYNANDAAVAMVDGEAVILDTVQVDTFALVSLFALEEELKYRQFFDTVYVDTIPYNKENGGYLYKKLTTNQVSDICKRFNADAVLAIDGVKYETTVIAKNMGDEYYTTMDMSGMLVWRLYDNVRDKVIYETIHKDTLFWDGVGPTVNTSTIGMPSIKNGMIEVAGFLGASFVDKIVPYWESVKRRVFVSGNPHFVNATEWLNRKNRDEAEKLWGFIYENGKPLDKARAASNIALSMEARGDFKEAMEWGFKSYELYQSVKGIAKEEEKKRAKELYSGLVRRHRDHKRLKNQMGELQ